MRGFLSVLLFAFVSSVHAAVYTWIDEHGVKQFSDKPPQSLEQVRTIQVPLIETVRTRPVPHQAAANNSRKPASSHTSRKVVMYSAEWCGVCKRARKYFQENRIAFREKDIDKSTPARREFKELGGRGVPLILVGKRKLSGFSPDSFEKIYRR